MLVVLVAMTGVLVRAPPAEGGADFGNSISFLIATGRLTLRRALSTIAA